MRNIRIFQEGPLNAGARLELDPAAANHVSRVLRLREGAALTLFDGGGGEYPAKLVRVEKRRVEVQLGDFRDHEVRHNLHARLTGGALLFHEVSLGAVDWDLRA